MEESVTYQAIVEEGCRKEARKILLLIGTVEFKGPPDTEQLNELNAIADVRRLEDMAVQILHVRSWSELLATAPRSRRRKKA